MLPILKIKKFNGIVFPLGRYSNILTITFTEYCRSFKKNSEIILWRYHLPFWLYRSYRGITTFWLGKLATLLTVTILKSCVGELRPNFYQQCRPNINCSLPENQEAYHWNFHCTNPHPPSNLKRSFPSGHSNFITYCACFFILYTWKRLATLAFKPLKYLTFFCQLSFVCVAVFVSFLQILDHSHHAIDVWVGCGIGVGFAVLACREFSKKKFENSPDLDF